VGGFRDHLFAPPFLSSLPADPVNGLASGNHQHQRPETGAIVQAFELFVNGTSTERIEHTLRQLFGFQNSPISRRNPASPRMRGEKYLSACRYLSLVLCGLMSGPGRSEVLPRDWLPLAELRKIAPPEPRIDEVAAGSFQNKDAPEIAGSGFVVKSLEAALWAFHNAADFQEVVLLAVNPGDDADTKGAVCGQLAGAYRGRSGMPSHRLTAVVQRTLIEDAISWLIQSQD